MARASRPKDELAVTDAGVRRYKGRLIPTPRNRGGGAMHDAPDGNGGTAGGMTRLTGREWMLLLVLGAVQFTHILDFMIVMPLGPQYMDPAKMALTPQQFSFMV